jgi:hypothetical protein
MSTLPRIVLHGMTILVLSACATPKPALRHSDDFGVANTFAHSFAGTESVVCEAARRALLGQGYLVREAATSHVKGKKNFQPDPDTHLQVDFDVVCAADSNGSNATTVFANAVRDTYTLKKSTTTASVGVSVLGSLSLPFGSTDDALVKVGSETIAARKFYDQFFERVEGYLGDPENGRAEDKSREPVEPASIKSDAKPAL